MPSANDEASENRTGIGPVAEYVRAIGAVLLASIIGVVLRPRLIPIDVAMLLLLAVVFVAARSRRGPAVLASVLGTACLDFLFVPPHYSFGVEDIRYVLTFAVMLAVSLTMTRLTARLREQAESALAGERRGAAIAALNRDLRDAGGCPALLAVAARHFGYAVGGEAAVVMVNETVESGKAPEWPTEGVFEGVDARVAAELAYRRGESAGSGTPRCAAADALVVPLGTPARRLGVVAVRPEPVGRAVEATERRIVEALADGLAAELERAAGLR